MNRWKAFQNRRTTRTKSDLARANEIVNEVFPRRAAKQSASEPVAAFTFGDVWARIWLNESKNGTEYLRISLHRIDAKDGSDSIRNSFRPQDLNDLVRAVRRCYLFLNSPSK